MSVIIPFIDDRKEQVEYLLSLADAQGVPHSDIVNTRDGWRVPQGIADAYDESAVLDYHGGGSMHVINAGTDLDTIRPDVACAYWKFDTGVDPGAAGENITYGRRGDLFFVAT